jgi:HEPN domain-containing protein
MPVSRRAPPVPGGKVPREYNPYDIDRRINDFAVRSFRDIADGDYIAARMACRAELVPQFLWSSQQAIEKYLKCMLLMHRIKAKVGHDIDAALKLTEKLPFKVQLRGRSRKFIEHIDRNSRSRYLEMSWDLHGHALMDLDITVWELRRYCQCLVLHGTNVLPFEAASLAEAQKRVEESTAENAVTFCIPGGALERILDAKRHPARGPLLWQNMLFGVRKRRRVRIKDFMHASNAPLYLFPDMLDELLKYIYMPKDMEVAYRAHWKAIQADPSRRP